MTERARRADLDVAVSLVEFVESEALPGSGVEPDGFWAGLSDILRELAPRNRELLEERDRLQHRLDKFHTANPGPADFDAYAALLRDIGYLVPEPDAFSISTEDVDSEIASQAGPQLVVPLLNARFAVNAVNARWGSLYDALYGSDVIPDDGATGRGDAYNPVRGGEAIARGRALLDEIAPLQDGSHAQARGYRVRDGALEVELGDGRTTGVEDVAAFAGFSGEAGEPRSILFVHNTLHVEVVIDREGRIGATDDAGVQDIVLESAVSTIMDLEDSVAAVDAEDKVLGYRNWRGLMNGTLSETVTKSGTTFVRTMNPDREFRTPAGAPFSLRARSLLLIRNVGHLMTTDAVLDASGAEVPEGILDAVMTTLGALSDIRGENTLPNSRHGSLYIVKPKMHGPEEVAFAVDLFARVEALLDLPPRTLKIGIMDEERRTTLNLRACIAAASDRVAFINTGFLDRTGDEIHTSLRAGAMVPKSELRGQGFLQTYEKANVEAGLSSGFAGRAQVGKGMWAMPDLMKDMLDQKIGQLRAGATTAWVPSPTAATLHALHYHDVDVFEIDAQLVEQPRIDLDPLLIPPLADGLPAAEVIATELDNNVQSILGYVVRWVDQGIGCSKVPDIHGVALMEDRATLRISSQLLANWLAHGLISAADVDASLHRLAPIVDQQNAHDPNYRELVADGVPGLAFIAARRLILEGASQPNGYTEPILHEVRRAAKAAHALVG